MDIPWSSVSFASVGGSIALVQFLPAYSIHVSYLQTFLLVFPTIGAITAFYHIILYPHLFSPFNHLPSPSGNSIYNGQWKRISEEPSGAPHQDWINTVPNEGLIYYRGLLNVERLMPTSPQALAEVLSYKSYDFIKPEMLRNGLGRILGVGLVLAEGDEHRAQRKNLMPAFAFRHVKDLYPTFWSITRRFGKNLTEEVRRQVNESGDNSSPAVVEIGNWVSRAALDIIGTAGMGQDFNALDDPDTELNATYRKVFQPTRSGQILGLIALFLPQWIIRAIPASHNNNLQGGAETIKKVCRQLIRTKRETLRIQEKRTEFDILSVALESGGFSDEDLVNQLMTFLAAGHETTATAMTWAVYLLCQNPEVQTKLRTAVREKLPPLDTDEQMTAQTLESCPYLHAVCSEVLRVYAPVPITMREAVKDTSILGQRVPKGTKILISAWGANHSQQMWGADASKFNPDRWMAPGKAGNGGAESNYAFMTFLHGPRSCIGQAFAKAEFACLLAAVVGRFEFELEEPEGKIEIQMGITARPKGGLGVKMKVVEGW